MYVFRGLLPVLVLLMVAAPAAHATVTPLNAAVSATSSNWTLASDAGDFTDNCPRADFTGRVTPDGRSISGTLSAFADRGITCTVTGAGLPPRTSSDNFLGCRITLRSNTSVAGTSAMFSLTVDSGCVERIPAIGITLTFDVQTIVNCVTFNQAMQTLTFNCRGMWTAGAGASRTMTMRGTFSVSTRLTLS